MIIKDSTAEKVIETALSNGADFAEIYCENTYTNRMALRDQKLSDSMVGKLNGAGIRIHYGTEEIYSYTNDLSEKALLDTASIAAKALKGKNKNKSTQFSQENFDSIHNYKAVPWEISKDTKLGYLERLDKAARAKSSKVTQADASLAETHKQVQVINSEGLMASETRQYINTMIKTIAEDAGKKEIGYERIGQMASGQYFESVDFEDLAEKATASALINLDAEYAPAGKFPVVLNNAFGGVIFHEACGHGLETTSVAKNASVFCDQLEKQIAASCVTAIDDGTIPTENGSLAMDDEGMATQKTVLIENGVLKSYLVDRLGSLKTGFARTGSGRRQDYRFSPTSRMRNTYIAAGDSSLEEMIADIDFGIFAKKLGGGSVTPGTGAYNFAVSEAYLIRNGKIDKPIKGASLIGTGIDTLSKISKVGKDLKLAAGTCGSSSGWVPVTVGQPAMLVSELTVGGRA